VPEPPAPVDGVVTTEASLPAVLVLGAVLVAAEASATQQTLVAPTAGSPKTALPQGTESVKVPSTLFAAVPYLTLRVPLNSQVWYSLAHSVQDVASAAGAADDAPALVSVEEAAAGA